MPRKNTPDNSKLISIEQARGKIAKAVRDLAAGYNPGPVTFRLKRTKKVDETYPLRLTQQQRVSMIHATRIKNKAKERLQQAGEGTQTLNGKSTDDEVLLVVVVGLAAQAGCSTGLPRLR
jgi:hypothetical protein